MPRDFLQQARLLRIALQLLGQHLRIGRNHRQRRVHFVRYTRRQQADRRKLVGLGELAFQFDAFGNVVHYDQAANHLELARHQRGDGHVDGSSLARGRLQAELVEVVDAAILPDAVKLLDEFLREDTGHGLR